MLGGDPSVTANDVQGTSKFATLGYVRGTEFLTINVVVNIDKYPVPSGMPANMNETRGERTYTQSETVPDGPYGPATNFTSSFVSTYLFEGRADNGATVRVQGSVNTATSCQRTLMQSVKTGSGQ